MVDSLIIFKIKAITLNHSLLLSSMAFCLIFYVCLWFIIFLFFCRYIVSGLDFMYCGVLPVSTTCFHNMHRFMCFSQWSLINAITLELAVLGTVSRWRYCTVAALNYRTNMKQLFTVLHHTWHSEADQGTSWKMDCIVSHCQVQHSIIIIISSLAPQQQLHSVSR